MHLSRLASIRGAAPAGIPLHRPDAPGLQTGWFRLHRRMAALPSTSRRANQRPTVGTCQKDGPGAGGRRRRGDRAWSAGPETSPAIFPTSGLTGGVSLPPRQCPRPQPGSLHGRVHEVHPADSAGRSVGQVNGEQGSSRAKAKAPRRTHPATCCWHAQLSPAGCRQESTDGVDQPAVLLGAYDRLEAAHADKWPESTQEIEQPVSAGNCPLETASGATHTR